MAADETAVTVRLHYMTSGSARVAFVIRRQEFFIPVRLCPFPPLTASYVHLRRRSGRDTRGGGARHAR